MIDQAHWQERNASHLASALEWVRLRLARAAESLGAEVPPSVPTPSKGADWSLFRPRNPAPRPGTMPPAPVGDLDGAIGRAERRIADLEAGADPPPALVALARRLGLGRFERDVVLLAAAVELDTRVASLCARAQDDPSRPFATFALALSLFDEPEWSALAADRPLRAWRLVEVFQPAATPLIASALRIDERVIHFLKGMNQLDDRLAAIASRVRPEGGLPPSQAAVADELAAAWRAAPGEWPPTQVLGPDPAGKRLVAEAAARAAGRRLYRIAAEDLPADPSTLDAFARLAEREARLLPIAFLVDAHSDAPSAAARLAGREGFVGLVAAPDPILRSPGPIVTVDVAKPTTREQAEAWSEALGGDETAAARLAGQFHLNLPAIRRAADEARAAAPDDPDGVAQVAWDVCRRSSRPRVGALARRIDVKADWGAIVLPEAVESTLRRMAEQVRHRATVYGAWGFDRLMNRGLGISALFSGPSGTGKTMAAEVLANDLGLDLFRIDLSTVVSKYIGETEKHLSKLFDAFEESGALLFFDEADALFGKRTEVRDSHDRYANIEVNYLLQRLETYRGVAILATNFRSACDPAFVRRLRFIVEFPAPGAAERKRIWARAFPRPDAADPDAAHAPTAGLEADRLSHLELTGGSIHAAAINAAFRAAAAGSPVTMAEILAAARDEYTKLERPVLESDFRWPNGREVHA